MKQKLLFLTLWTMLAFTNVQAQCDTWIIKAYQELYGRAPNAQECNIRNYNNGSWNNYSELVSYIKKYNSQTTASSSCDPWIVLIYKSEFGREPNATECNIKNYNNGSWGSYDQLKGYIRQYKTQTTAAPATNCDPWIVDIYKKEFGREPNATECNIRNYNNGSWGSYDQLKGFIKQYKGVSSSQVNTGWKYTPSTVSGDPWITQIYQELYRRKPNAWEYNVNNYVEGKWQNREQLKQAIQQYQNNMRKAGMTIDLYDMGNGRFVVDLKVNGKSTAVSMIEGKGGNVVAAGGANVVSAGGAKVVSAGGANVVSAGGANVVSGGGANVVSAGGANVIAPGGANVVSAGGGNVIAPGGGNIVVNANAAGFNMGKLYGVNSGARQVIRTSGNGAIVIK